jgi:hypothetical protein
MLPNAENAPVRIKTIKTILGKKNYIFNRMEQNTCREANSPSGIKGILRIMQSNVSLPVEMNPKLVTVLSQINQVHAIKMC